jgi:hypothetical protein
MERRELILELCHEAGDTGSKDEIIKEWEACHACCCNLKVHNASQGDVETLKKIRKCMGLELTR